MSRFLSDKRARLTPYVPGEQPQNRKYIKLNTNESPFPPSPEAQRRAQEEAANLMLYSDPECRDLAKTASDMLGVGADEILFTNGSDEILNFAFMAFGGKAAFPDITYGFYPVFASLNDVDFVEIPLKPDFSICPDDFIGLGRNIFIANPNAPTGLTLSRAEIEKIIAGNPDNVVVIDEAYVDFGGESVLPLIRKYDNLLVVQTFSKSRSLAGARLGFGAGCPELIADLNRIKYATNPYNVNRMTMAAGIGALTDTAYFDENRKKIVATRARITAKLRELGFTVLDSSANFVFAAHPGIGGREFYLALKERGVLVRHFDKPRLTDYNRITIGSDEEMDAFITITEEII